MGSTAVVTTKAATNRSGSLLGILVVQQPSAPFSVDIQVADVGRDAGGVPALRPDVVGELVERFLVK